MRFLERTLLSGEDLVDQKEGGLLLLLKDVLQGLTEGREGARRKYPLVRITKSGCWEWNPVCASGYGMYRKGSALMVAHRFVYDKLIGKIPEGKELDHLCRNRRCVNPNHVEPVTHRENLLRGIGPSAKNKVKTMCPNGHKYTKENTGISKNKYGYYRRCRACDRKRSRKNG
jgi:hypothetical protein